jgi:hypothetical protein
MRSPSDHSQNPPPLPFLCPFLHHRSGCPRQPGDSSHAELRECSIPPMPAREASRSLDETRPARDGLLFLGLKAAGSSS